MSIPTTKEQIAKNREFIDSNLAKIIDRARSANLIYAVLFYWSDISKCVEYRVGYFEENFEANIWLDEFIKKYEKLGIPTVDYSGK